MDETLIEEVWHRAGGACEYCQMPQAFHAEPHQIDHIIARQHGGRTMLGNLALACFFCNSHKGPNIVGIDPATRKQTVLFNPRRHKWSRHFRWDGPVLVGRTAIGRATITVLAMNHSVRVAFRTALIADGLFPPHA